jgi:hypothetical protein
MNDSKIPWFLVPPVTRPTPEPQAKPQTEPQADPLIAPQIAPEALFTAGDVAEAVKVSVTTVKRIAAELRLDVQHTVGGLKLYTGGQVVKIRAERERRQQEALRP